MNKKVIAEIIISGVYADGTLDVSEETFLEELAQAYDIPADIMLEVKSPKPLHELKEDILKLDENERIITLQQVLESITSGGSLSESEIKFIHDLCTYIGVQADTIPKILRYASHRAEMNAEWNTLLNTLFNEV